VQRTASTVIRRRIRISPRGQQSLDNFVTMTSGRQMQRGISNIHPVKYPGSIEPRLFEPLDGKAAIRVEQLSHPGIIAGEDRLKQRVH
jgi:hypothetical protein